MGLVRHEGDTEDDEDDEDRTGEEEVDGGLGKIGLKGVTLGPAEGDKEGEEEDLERDGEKGDLVELEELEPALEDVFLLSE